MSTQLRLIAAGRNDFGQCGIAPRKHARHPYAIPPTVVRLPKLPKGASVQFIAAGQYHTLLIAQWRVYHAGNNEHGQRGNRTTDRVPHPDFFVVPGITSAVFAACGAYFNTVKLADETVMSWGCGDEGQLGRDGDPTRPLPIPGLKDVVTIAAGYDFVFVIRRGGEVFCWGNNEKGQLCLGQPGGIRRTPQRVELLCGAAVQIALSAEAGIALCSDGAVRAWGILDGMLADGSGSWNRSRGCVPLAIDLGGPCRLVAAGGQHFAALSSTSVLHTWGYLSHGQLARLGNAELPAPAVLPGDHGTPSEVCCSAICTFIKGSAWTVCGNGAYFGCGSAIVLRPRRPASTGKPFTGSRASHVFYLEDGDEEGTTAVSGVLRVAGKELFEGDLDTPLCELGVAAESTVEVMRIPATAGPGGAAVSTRTGLQIYVKAPTLGAADLICVELHPEATACQLVTAVAEHLELCRSSPSPAVSEESSQEASVPPACTSGESTTGTSRDGRCSIQ
eukprot:TRINITY_DN15739_c0_g1_i1.p1 TRINITY_DN15739_c0_g1~~TRINITY_DN15739_c0_g1_i1.p1  ORF type:complete len:504 (+),score=96.59 TRINITY_DN15739_c0_g1_i1:126-1637(+)